MVNRKMTIEHITVFFSSFRKVMMQVPNKIKLTGANPMYINGKIAITMPREIGDLFSKGDSNNQIKKSKNAQAMSG